MVIAVAFGAAAAFHAFGVHAPGRVGDVPAWRHALFVVINVACCAGYVRRDVRGFFVTGMFVLALQQLASHGADLVRAWTERHALDVPSLVIVLAMPAVAFVAFSRWRHGTRS